MVLVTSAAPGKKAAPKGAPRRRAQPTQPASSAPPQPPSQAATNLLTKPKSTQNFAAEQSPASIDLAPVKESDAPVSEPIREPEVDQARSEPVQNVVAPPVADPPSTPAVAKEHTPQPKPIRLPDPTSEAVSEPVVQQTPPRTQTQTAEQSDASRAEKQPLGTGTAASIVDAQQRLEDYHVSQDPVADSADAAQSATPPAQVEAPKSTNSSQRGSTTAKVLEAHSASAAKSRSAPKRKARAAPESTTDEPRPAKRNRNTGLTESPAPTTAGSQEPGALEDSHAAPDGEATVVQDETLTHARRRQPARKVSGAKREINAKSAEIIVDSDDEHDENEATADAATAVAEDDPEADQERVRPARKKQKRVQIESKPKKPKVRKRKFPKPVSEGEEAKEQEEYSGSDPELHEIDPNTLSMWDLSRDAFHGKMSERGKAMEAIDWEAEKAKRRAAADLIASGGQQPAAETTVDGTTDGTGVMQSTEGQDGAAESATQAAASTKGHGQTEDAGQDQGDPTVDTQPADSDEPTTGNDDDIGFVLDDEGNIVADTTTLVVDRQAGAIAAAASDRPVEEINDLTTLNNRTTWMNENRRDVTDRVPIWKWKSDPWSEEETDEFYDALRMFGTDFLIISKMFPPKTRRMIKAKFVREEKLDPDRITRALNGQETRKLDLDYYAQKTSREISIFTKYSGLEDAQAKIKEEMGERHAELATAAAQEEQRAAEKRIEESLQRAKQSKKTRKPKKPKMGGMGGFGGGGGPEDGD